MKRYGNLYDKTFTMDALFDAFVTARQHKRAKLACFRFERNLGANLAALHQELTDGSYRPRPFSTFTVTEPKTREIQAPVFRDCVVQHAAYKTIYPIFDAAMCRDSYACRVGGGAHRASARAQMFMRQSDPDDYYLEMDIRKFFPSINHDILSGILARKIKDQRMLGLLRMFFNAGKEGVGLPIGYLLSQIFANIYLDQVDRFCKRELGMRRYVRYMDNFACIGMNLAAARDVLGAVRRFVADRLQMGLSKFTLQKIRRGFNFVGYRTWPSKTFIRKRSLYNFSRAVRAGETAPAVSILGHAMRTRSLNYLLDMARENNHVLYRQIPESIRRLHHVPA